mmetsp:Transcript_20370/g.57995  ORF Transcript_20370/g.57995 Transcript_20370/m.57995 type:complete len:200 (+) Transcript_20370:306-905(+)
MWRPGGRGTPGATSLGSSWGATGPALAPWPGRRPRAANARAAAVGGSTSRQPRALNFATTGAGASSSSSTDAGFRAHSWSRGCRRTFCTSQMSFSAKAEQGGAPQGPVAQSSAVRGVQTPLGWRCSAACQWRETWRTEQAGGGGVQPRASARRPLSRHRPAAMRSSPGGCCIALVEGPSGRAGLHPKEGSGRGLERGVA